MRAEGLGGRGERGKVRDEERVGGYEEGREGFLAASLLAPFLLHGNVAWGVHSMESACMVAWLHGCMVLLPHLPSQRQQQRHLRLKGLHGWQRRRRMEGPAKGPEEQ